MNTPVILSVNSGSSSIKFALYPVVEGVLAASCLTGVIEGLEPGGSARIQMCLANGSTQKLSLEGSGARVDEQFAAALQALHGLMLEHSQGLQLLAVAHRIVHGGERYAASVVLDDAVLAYLHTLDSLAPLHQPHNLEGVTAFRKAYPEVPQIACFDTGFHAAMPVNETTLALPATLRDAGIRRFGFHGLSYRYVAAHLMQQSARASDPAAGRAIMLHLGNGASACAVLSGSSVATSMGFSALDGLMMGTRCGALDPGVLLYLMQQGWDAKRLENMLYKESGLLGLSGISADMRSLRASQAPSARAAIDLFTYRVIRECGALSACLHGLDVLAFTGGIGEHDAILREQVVEGLAYLGLKINPQKNQMANSGLIKDQKIMSIHADDSSVEIWVVPTDEGYVAATDAMQLLKPKAMG